MSPSWTVYCPARYSFPRVSGDEPGGWAYVTGADKFSPRERG